MEDSDIGDDGAGLIVDALKGHTTFISLGYARHSDQLAFQRFLPSHLARFEACQVGDEGASQIAAGLRMGLFVKELL